MFNKPSLAKDGHKIKKFNLLYIVYVVCICMYVHNTIFDKHDL